MDRRCRAISCWHVNRRSTSSSFCAWSSSLWAWICCSAEDISWGASLFMEARYPRSRPGGRGGQNRSPQRRTTAPWVRAAGAASATRERRPVRGFLVGGTAPQMLAHDSEVSRGVSARRTLVRLGCARTDGPNCEVGHATGSRRAWRCPSRNFLDGRQPCLARRLEVWPWQRIVRQLREPAAPSADRRLGAHDLPGPRACVSLTRGSRGEEIFSTAPPAGGRCREPAAYAREATSRVSRCCRRRRARK